MMLHMSKKYEIKLIASIDGYQLRADNTKLRLKGKYEIEADI